MRLVSLFVGLLVIGSGCGYQVVGYRSASQESVRISIRTLANDTLEPGVELMVSDALRREFLRAGRIRLVEESVGADYAVSGRVRALDTSSRSFSSGVRALEFTLSMALQIDVDGRRGKRLELDRFALQESEIYLASADVEVSRKNREEATRRLAAVLAGRVYDEIELLTGDG
jgi:hypothetical protein